MHRRLPLAVAVTGTLLVALSLAPGGGAALPGQQVAAGPGAWLSTYATPAAAVEQGGKLGFTNGDIMYHDVVSKRSGADDAPWCQGYPSGACPLFWSPLIGLGETSDVLGLEHLEPGTTYTFYCTIHPHMTGTLVALERLD